MAGDWIKMRTDLYRDPKVIAIADHLMLPEGELSAYVGQNCQRDMTVTRNVMRNVTVGALVAVWGVARHQGKRYGDDLRMSCVTLSVIDDVAEVPGFGAAMAEVGWVAKDGPDLIFPRFFETHNADPREAAKANNRERQRRFRERKRNVTEGVTRNVTVTHREEKSREEKKETPCSPPSENSEITAEQADAMSHATRPPATQLPAAKQHMLDCQRTAMLTDANIPRVANFARWVERLLEAGGGFAEGLAFVQSFEPQDFLDASNAYYGRKKKEVLWSGTWIENARTKRFESGMEAKADADRAEGRKAAAAASAAVQAEADRVAEDGRRASEAEYQTIAREWAKLPKAEQAKWLRENSDRSRAAQSAWWKAKGQGQ